MDIKDESKSLEGTRYNKLWIPKIPIFALFIFQERVINSNQNEVFE